jgi:hypothetical protein
VLEREAVTWQQTADRMRGLIAYYESRLGDVADDQPDADRRPNTEQSAAEDVPRISVERFGKIVIPLANALITASRAPVPVEDIYRALPDHIRRELDEGSTVYSTPFRIRRMFRRNPSYQVTKDGVTFAGQTAPEAVPANATVSRVMYRHDGGIAAMSITGPDGITAAIKPSEIRAALRAGQRIYLPERNGRRSELRLAGGRFYSEDNGVENDDFTHLLHSFEPGTEG